MRALRAAPSALCTQEYVRTHSSARLSAQPPPPAHPREPAAMASPLQAFLEGANLSQYTDHITTLGVTEVAHLSDVEDSELLAMGMSTIEIRRLQRKLADDTATAPATLVVPDWNTSDVESGSIGGGTAAMAGISNKPAPAENMYSQQQPGVNAVYNAAVVAPQPMLMQPGIQMMQQQQHTMMTVMQAPMPIVDHTGVNWLVGILCCCCGGLGFLCSLGLSIASCVSECDVQPMYHAGNHALALQKSQQATNFRNASAIIGAIGLVAYIILWVALQSSG
jgi:hypothetical protein